MPSMRCYPLYLLFPFHKYCRIPKNSRSDIKNTAIEKVRATCLHDTQVQHNLKSDRVDMDDGYRKLALLQLNNT